jgi:MinD-like ATPase involved in chromosome partitioning or flagellar assembly
MLRDWHDYVVIDTPVNLRFMASPLLRSSNLILLLLTPEPTAIRQAQTSLDVLYQSGISPTQIWPVLNMMRPEQLPVQQQIEKLWNRPVAAVLPWLPAEFERARTDRQLIVQSQPNSTLATTIQGLAEQIIQTAHPQNQETIQDD